jgi:uncharacterized protein (UPF0262 family)
MAASPKSLQRIVHITLDERPLSLAPEIAHERDVAIADLLERNHFAPAGVPGGPFTLRLSIAEGRLLFDVALAEGEEQRRIGLSLVPFRRVIKDYFLICESHYAAMREAPAPRIEALDMTRRSLHGEGARLLAARLKGKAEVDFNTARRLFTLLCALHFRG